MIKDRKTNLSLLITSIVLLCCIYLYWSLVCKTGACSFQLRNDFLRPVAQGLIFLSIAFSLFLPLPKSYFTAWFKYIFTWAFPLTVLLVVTSHNETDYMVISKSDVTRLLGILFCIVTVVFVAIQYFRHRK
jgi:hypothetical protein